jgi:WD40 repeat protein
LSDESYATSSFDGTVKIWNPEDFKLEYSCPTLQTSFNDIVEITNHKLEENT